MRFSPEFLDRVRDATDIVAVISEHVQLKRSGRTWKARCPFHQEKTPSFTVNPDRQIFKCFGCGIGGDVFRFLMEFEKLSFPEAVELLAERAGIPLPRGGWSGPPQESVYPALEWAAGFYRKSLAGPTGAKARDYLDARGLGREVQERFGLGWAPPGWSNLLEHAGKRYPVPLLERAGLVVTNAQGGHYDRFRARVMIPIRSALGRTIGFGARTLGDEQPKYLNSPETEVFSKGRVLYGLPEAKEALKETGEGVVVEGYMDALALAQAGIANVVASCGTAFTADQARVLHRYVGKAVLLFDGDAAGIRAAWKSAAVFLGEGLEVRVVALPEGEDPDSFVRRHGAETMREWIARAPGVVGFAHDTLLGRVAKREDLLKAFAYLGARVDDPIRRRVLLQEAAEQFRFDEAVLVQEARRMRRTGGDWKAEAKAPAPTGPVDRLGRFYLATLLSRGEVGPEDLLPEEVLREEGLQDLYRRWLALREGEQGNATARLLEEEGTRDLAAEILSESREGEEGTEWDQVLARLRGRVQKARGEAIREAIREAEAEGKSEEVVRLLRELQGLRSTEH